MQVMVRNNMISVRQELRDGKCQFLLASDCPPPEIVVVLSDDTKRVSHTYGSREAQKNDGVIRDESELRDCWAESSTAAILQSANTEWHAGKVLCSVQHTGTPQRRFRHF
jgi:hypothetical protein